jgi:hypothetical protein
LQDLRKGNKGQTMTAELNKIRDELADKYFGVTSLGLSMISQQPMFESDNERSLINNMQKRHTFLAGFDAAAELLSKQIEPLEKALRFLYDGLEHFHNDDELRQAIYLRKYIVETLTAYKLKGSE